MLVSWQFAVWLDGGSRFSFFVFLGCSCCMLLLLFAVRWVVVCSVTVDVAFVVVLAVGIDVAFLL